MGPKREAQTCWPCRADRGRRDMRQPSSQLWRHVGSPGSPLACHWSQGGRWLVPEPGRCGEPRVQAGSLHPRDSSRRKPPPPAAGHPPSAPAAVASVLWCNGARLHPPGLCPRMPVGPRAVASVPWCNGARCTYPASARAGRSVPAQWLRFSGATGPVAPTRPLPAHAGRPPRSGFGSLVQRGPLHLPGLCPRRPVGPRAVASVPWCNGARCTYPASARACRSVPAQWLRFSGATGPVAPTPPLPAQAGPPRPWPGG